MGSNAQKRATESYRERLAEKDMGRVEVVCVKADRDLIRAFARFLIENEQSADVEHLRSYIGQIVRGKKEKGDSLVRAIRNSPLVGADIDLSRTHVTSRKVEL